MEMNKKKQRTENTRNFYSARMHLTRFVFGSRIDNARKRGTNKLKLITNQNR